VRPGAPRVRAAAAEDELGQHLRHGVHGVAAAPSQVSARAPAPMVCLLTPHGIFAHESGTWLAGLQERAIAVLRGQVAVVRVHVGGALPGGPAQEGQPLQAQDQQELRRAGTGRDDGQEARLQLLRRPRPRRRQRVQDGPNSERVPPVRL
jgi:hypothetical protein